MRFVFDRSVRCIAVALFSIAAALLQVAPARATGMERFSQFINSTQSARGEFEQRIVDKRGKVVQESRGSLAFSRPGKFRWTYVKPYAQLIVGDGSKVWIYDQDLKQVTIKRMGQALTSTPAALLAGNNDAMRAFTITEQGEKDGLQWVEAVPREKEGGFERVRMGFGADGIQTMELVDSFGQFTVLRFISLVRNPKLDASLFRFTPPKGADVIGE